MKDNTQKDEIKAISEEFEKMVNWTTNDSINGYPPQIFNPEECISNFAKSILNIQKINQTFLTEATKILQQEANARICGNKIVFINPYEITSKLIKSYQKSLS